MIYLKQFELPSQEAEANALVSIGVLQLGMAKNSYNTYLLRPYYTIPYKNQTR